MKLNVFLPGKMRRRFTGHAYYYNPSCADIPYHPQKESQERADFRPRDPFYVTKPVICWVAGSEIYVVGVLKHVLGGQKPSLIGGSQATMVASIFFVYFLFRFEPVWYLLDSLWKSP